MKPRKGFYRFLDIWRLPRNPHSLFTCTADLAGVCSSNSYTCFCSGTGGCRLGDMDGACFNVAWDWKRLLSLLEKCSWMSCSCWSVMWPEDIPHKRKRLVHLLKIAHLTEQSEIFCFASFLNHPDSFQKLSKMAFSLTPSLRGTSSGFQDSYHLIK